MPIVTIPDLRRKYDTRLSKSIPWGMEKRAAFSRRLYEATASVKDTDRFDIFLSHSYRDAEAIVLLKEKLRDLGFTVYVDWQNDPQLSRENVSSSTASLLRRRIGQCRGLLLAATESSTTISRWVPWELGYADGAIHRVAIFPYLSSEIHQSTYKGNEYLGLYPYIDAAETLAWVNFSDSSYSTLRKWLDG